MLIVEDSAVLRGVVVEYLQRWGYEAIEAVDGLAGVRLFDSTKPDLVLLDVVMPGIDGFEVARRIRASTDDWRPILFLTTRDADVEIAAGMDAGGDDYLIKPVSPPVLRAKMLAMERISLMRTALVKTQEELLQTVARLDLVAHLDGLTGLPNRRRLDAKLGEELARSRRAQRPLSVVLIDVDHFKPYNDTLGHVAGDECLKLVARILGGTAVRAGDLVARYGGEEFIAVLPDTSLPEALDRAEALRRAIEGEAIPHPSGGVLTISLGVATTFSRRTTVEQLVAAADRALYEAKSTGRNRICVHRPEASPDSPRAIG